jgi:hypothetical protein
MDEPSVLVADREARLWLHRGPGGVSDYSTWTFTYTNKYHLITN